MASGTSEFPYLEASLSEMGRGVGVAQRIEFVFLQLRLSIGKENYVVQEEIEGEREYGGSLLRIQYHLGVLSSRSTSALQEGMS